MLEDIWGVAAATLNWLWNLSNSNFFTALVGAFAGAYGAQAIVERAGRKKRLLEEIRNTNAAIVVACSITNTFCALKSQHVKGLKENLDAQRKELEIFKQARKQGAVAPEEAFYFQADFQSLPVVQVPIDVLRNLLFEKLSLVGRPLSIVAVLSQTIDSVIGAIERRNRIIDECKRRAPIPINELVPLYFGLPNKDGHVDMTYSETVSAIYSHTDDCIFFSHLLGEDLEKHGKRLAKVYGSKAPRIEKTAFTNAERKALLPDPSLYSDWMKMPDASVDPG
ncbi:hypothetical protein ACFPL7_00990 [Dongia soli]|uniref:Uncharacterized protein n=1 Tax=Dongia soli TaxID=600628 RepID=A0ABU5EFD5_9PROT|nr:hypothetical protein [Dongia soli]MDY0884316.1 hypothetical protein [Dongia soli]